MARTKKPEPPKISAPIQPQIITDALEKNFMPYAMSVILSRAIPDIDGFKPAHRKVLFTMHGMGLLRGDRRKSADVVGQTMKVHPHGDGSIYETLVRLTRGNDALLYPFVDSKGNFGKRYSKHMAYAASRYTEVKLDSFCEELFKDISKNAVEMTDNYDGTLKEPSLFPTTFPNVLVTPNMGIAVGIASNICGFNLIEVCQATIAYIKDPNAQINKYITGPDFTTGGQYIYDETELQSVIDTGRGSLRLRSKYTYDKSAGCVEITEIPYTTTIEDIIDKTAALVKAGKIRDILDIRDETGLAGLKIAVDIRRSADPELIMQKLFAQTTLTDTFSCNFNVLIDGRPRTMGVREIIAEWLRFRVNCVRRAKTFDLQKAKEKLHLLEGLRKIILDVDKAIRIIRQTEDDARVIPNLCAGFSIDAVQAEFVAEIKLRNLNKEYLLSRVAEYEDTQKEIADLTEIISSDGKIHDIITAELKQIIKKYGKPRKTEIVYQLLEEPIVDFIEDYEVKLFLTENGYFKKITTASLRAAAEQFVKDGDAITQVIDATNKSDVLFFSNQQNVYKARLHEMAECKASAIGEYLSQTLSCAEGEKIVCFAAVTDYGGFMFFVYENGKAAKVDMSAYATKTNRKKLINAYSGASPLAYAAYIKEDADFVLFRGTEKAMLLNTALINPVSAKASQGVATLTLKRGSMVSNVLPAANVTFTDPEFYRTDKIPSSGHFLREDDKNVGQMKIEGI
ncbi:DNA gyrase subunit A [Clostridia bacterium]|nr:DNA gyrase subunit A [Clostridia bacterium]